MAWMFVKAETLKLSMPSIDLSKMLTISKYLNELYQEKHLKNHWSRWKQEESFRINKETELAIIKILLWMKCSQAETFIIARNLIVTNHIMFRGILLETTQRKTNCNKSNKSNWINKHQAIHSYKSLLKKFCKGNIAIKGSLSHHAIGSNIINS